MHACLEAANRLAGAAGGRGARGDAARCRRRGCRSSSSTTCGSPRGARSGSSTTRTRCPPAWRGRWSGSGSSTSAWRSSSAARPSSRWRGCRGATGIGSTTGTSSGRWCGRRGRSSGTGTATTCFPRPCSGGRTTRSCGAQAVRTAEVEYVRILHLAASTMETDVAQALERLLAAGTVPTADARAGLRGPGAPGDPGAGRRRGGSGGV